MATLDDGIANLERFIANLTTATGALPQVTTYLQEKEHGFTELEGHVTDEGDGLTQHLEEAGNALDQGLADVGQALTGLAHAATDGQGTAADAQAKLEHAAADLEDKAHALVDGLEKAQASLADHGFSALDHAVQEAEQQLQTEGHEAQQALSELEAAVHGFEGKAQAAWGEAEGELEQATSRLGQDEADLTGEANEGVQGFAHTADEMESHCTSLQGELATIYGAFGTGVQEQGNEWDQTWQNAAQQAVGAVETGRQQHLDQPAGLVRDEALVALGQEYQALQALLESAADTVAEVEPLAEDLTKCEAVVAQVDQLLNALAG